MNALKVLLPVATYILFVFTGMLHEVGHLVAAHMIGAETGRFEVVRCLMLVCRVPVVIPENGWERAALLYSGGIIAASIWIVLYLITARWHQTSLRWWVIGAVLLAFGLAEVTTAMLEGGFSAMYLSDSSMRRMGSLAILFLAFTAGIGLHTTVTHRWKLIASLVRTRTLRRRQGSDW